MKANFNYATLIFIVICMMSFSNSVTASHIYGEEITYRCIDSVNQVYLVELRLYRDCAGITLPNTTILNVSSSSCASSFNATLPKQFSMESSPFVLKI